MKCSILAWMVILASTVPLAADEVGDLVGKLESRNQATRVKAIEELGELGPKASSAVPALLPLLNEKTTIIRVKAIQALGAIKSKAAVPGLEVLAKDRTPSVKAAAERALESIGPLSDEEKLWVKNCRKFVALKNEFIKLPELDSKAVATMPKLETLTPGAIGYISALKVMDVIDESTLLANSPTPTTSISFSGLSANQSFGEKDRLLCLKGHPTAGLVNDEKMKSTDNRGFAVVGAGTWSYTTVAGAKSTIPLVIPAVLAFRGITLDEFRQLRKRGEKFE